MGPVVMGYFMKTIIGEALFISEHDAFYAHYFTFSSLDFYG